MAKKTTSASVNTLTVVPADGRDYQSAEAAVKDWLAEKDFLIMDVSCPWNGKYVNRQQVALPGMAPIHVKIRYAKKTNIVFVDNAGQIVGRVDDDSESE